MKRTYILIATLAAFSAMSFAQNTAAPAPVAKTPAVKKEMKKAEVLVGEISAVNTEKNEITLKVKKDKAEKTLAIDPKEIANLKAGQEVKIKLMDGKVESIKPVIKHEKKHNKPAKKAEVKTEKPAETK